MRYELSDNEWRAIRVMLPDKPEAWCVWMKRSQRHLLSIGRARRGAIGRLSAGYERSKKANRLEPVQAQRHA